MRKICGLVMTALFCLTVAVGCSEPPKAKDDGKKVEPPKAKDVKDTAKDVKDTAKDVKDAVKDAPKEEPKK